jgi:hypothetical protein
MASCRKCGRSKIKKQGGQPRKCRRCGPLKAPKPPICPGCGVYPAQWTGTRWGQCDGCEAYDEHTGAI